MTTSKNGLAFVSREEGDILYPYNDSAGNATIGVGHLLHHSPVTSADRAGWRGFTFAKSQALLAHDIKAAEAAVNPVAHLLNQNQYDACVSLTFNIGTGGFAGSSVKRNILARNYAAAANSFYLWAHPSELAGRRARERALFLRPVRHSAVERLRAELNHRRAQLKAEKNPGTRAFLMRRIHWLRNGIAKRSK